MKDLSQTPDYEIDYTESVQDSLKRSASPDDEWLWCIFCETFFQARHLRVDYLGNRQGCAFCRCAGFDCAIFRWDTFRNDEEPGWPSTEDEIYHGCRLPRFSGTEHDGAA